MKINKVITVLLLALFVFTGCEENFLDVTDPNRVTEDQFWQTEDDAFKALTAAYAQLTIPLWGRWGHYECKILVENYRTDLGYFMPDYDEWVEMYSFRMSEENYTKDYYWYYYYQGIYQTNIFLENIDRVEMDNTMKAQMVGEAKFLRAFYHLKLVTYFKNIPLILAVPTVAEDFYPTQATPDAVYTQCIQDFTDAANALPTQWESRYKGRATKGAANAYLGLTHIYKTNPDWSAASSAFGSVINSGQYDLLPEFWDNFNGMSENGPESVFELQFTVNRPNNVSESQTLPAQFGAWGQGGPSDWYFDMMMNDKKADGSYSDRVYGTFFFDDPNTTAFWFEEGDTWGSTEGDRKLWKKWVYKSEVETANEPSWDRSGVNTVEMRFADVLLMQAECLNEQGQTTQAIDIINLVRARSGVTPIGTLSQSELRNHIRNYERPAELAFEGKRWADLVRWGVVEPTLRTHNNPYVDNFDVGVDEYLPIPSIDLNNNPNLVQNPGF
ncbi:MAG: RagB/SusD family nutrient uptake outer membrane protein [Bacteroidetes bacterium]|nr:RagB/SusD family nutrient uptake outer membrane protein [Bacteroidota bacterium]